MININQNEEHKTEITSWKEVTKAELDWLIKSEKFDEFSKDILCGFKIIDRENNDLKTN
ncbi:MAG: hypothetical protein FWE03_07220 [Firmicutes bacterium]|nr:hypothetical protein [Bacillota bacterium]